MRDPVAGTEPASVPGAPGAKRAAIEFAVANHAPREDGPPSLIVLHTTQAHLGAGPVDLERLAELYNDPQLGQSSHVANDASGSDARYVADDLAAFGDGTPQAGSLHLAQVGVEDQSAWPRPQLANTAAWLAHWSQNWGIPLVHSPENGVCQHSDLDPAVQDCGPTYPLDFVLALARDQLAAGGQAAEDAPAPGGSGAPSAAATPANAQAPSGPQRAPTASQIPQEAVVNKDPAQPAANKLVPLQTTPLTKFIRTGEGVLIFAFNLAMLITPIVSSALTPTQAAKWAGIIDGVAVVARTGLKMVSLTQTATGTTPEPIGGAVLVDAQQLAAELRTQLPADLHGPVSADQLVEQLMADTPVIEQLVSDTEEMTSTPESDPAATGAGGNGSGASAGAGAADAAVPEPVLAAAGNGGAQSNASTYLPPETAITPDPPLADGEPINSQEG